MIRTIDSFLNKISMYRLVLYELLVLVIAALVLSALHLLPYKPLYIGYSLVLIIAVCWTVNTLFAHFYEAPSNPESTYITALILVLIITPPQTLVDLHFITLAVWASAWAMASKYIFAIHQKHVFNPAALGVAVAGVFLNQGASWWIGTLWMLPFVLVGGCLVVRKIRRFAMVVVFLAGFVATILLLSISKGFSTLHTIEQAFLHTQVVFFALILLTEPLTSPTSRYSRLFYALVMGFLSAPVVHLGSFYFTPEITLLTGNIFSYLVNSKQKLTLVLKEKIQLATDTYEFVFASNRKLSFHPGQYLEWTLAHHKSDSRGIRRFFTIASSPTDPDIRIGVKFYKPSSTFKDTLLSLEQGSTIVASQLAGDFTLPRNKKKKLVFIAGGIGITPFKSMIQYLVDMNERRDIVLIYLNRSAEDVAYLELLDRAEKELGINTLPIFNVPPGDLPDGTFPTVLSQEVLQTEIPDYADRYYYVSGPRGMVVAFSDLLSDSGIKKWRIRKDYFPGFS